MRKNRKPLYIATMLLVLAFGICLGNISKTDAKAGDDVYSSLGVFADVLHYVETNYVDQVSREELIYGAIKGMLDTLDPHSVFMPPDVYQEMKVDDTRAFEGLGLLIESKDNRLVVVSPIKDSPAEKAGLKRGDVIVAIGDQDCSGISIAEATGLMRGPAGSKVSLFVLRHQFRDVKEIKLTRRKIEIAYVNYNLLANGYGYVHIKAFKDGTSKKMISAIRKMEVQSGKALKGLVLDLRDNPGGLFSEAIKVADEFISKGVIVSTGGNNKAHVEEQRAAGSGSFLNGKMVVLINGNSASSAEIVCAALQDLKRAVIIGTKSFGKGSVQSIIDLDDGSGLKLTVARYFTPKQKQIDFMGIKPDVQVVQSESGSEVSDSYIESTDELGLRLLDALESPKSINPNDYQLRTAYAFLKLGKLSPKN